MEHCGDICVCRTSTFKFAWYMSGFSCVTLWGHFRMSPNVLTIIWYLPGFSRGTLWVHMCMSAYYLQFSFTWSDFGCGVFLYINILSTIGRFIICSIMVTLQLWNSTEHLCISNYDRKIHLVIVTLTKCKTVTKFEYVKLPPVNKLGFCQVSIFENYGGISFCRTTTK